MMKAAVLASVVASAAAFAPAPAGRSAAVATSAAMDGMPGSIDLRGKEFKFDPLKLSETYAPLLPWFRESELRHARTAMLAVVGFIVEDAVRLPGDIYSFEAVPTAASAHDLLMDKGPMGQLVLWIGLWDLVVTGPAAAAAMKGERTPGDFNWTLLQPKDEAGRKRMVDSELLNGRLAMFAIGGIATQSILTGHSFPYL